MGRIVQEMDRWFKGKGAVYLMQTLQKCIKCKEEYWQEYGEENQTPKFAFF